VAALGREVDGRAVERGTGDGRRGLADARLGRATARGDQQEQQRQAGGQGSMVDPMVRLGPTGQ
jgi:hypothetical protein